MSVIFLSREAVLSDIKSPSNTFTDLAVEDAAKFVLLSTKFKIDANEDQTSSEPGSFCIKNQA